VDAGRAVKERSLEILPVVTGAAAVPESSSGFVTVGAISYVYVYAASVETGGSALLCRGFLENLLAMRDGRERNQRRNHDQRVFPGERWPVPYTTKDMAKTDGRCAF